MSGMSGISGTLGASGMLGGMLGPMSSPPREAIPGRPQNFHSPSSLTNLDFTFCLFPASLIAMVTSAVFSSTSVTPATSSVVSSGMPSAAASPAPLLLQLVPELLARDGDQAVDVTRLQVIERLVGRRLGIISAEQDDQQDDAADDDEGADTAEDPGQRALLLGRFTAGETTGRWVAGWRALWRAVTTRPAPWWSVTAGLAVRRAVAWLLLRETAAGRLTLRVLGTRTLRAWWLGHLRPRLINATYG